MKKASKISRLGSKPHNSIAENLKVLYTRTSSIDQRTDRQRVHDEDFDWIIEDKISGSIEFFKRPGGEELKQLIDKGIVHSISIWSIDRCGRNLLDILQTLKYCTTEGIQVSFISQGLKTLDEDGKENPIAKMVISILGVIAEMQREQIREAQAQGIAIAKAKGVYKGRRQNSKETALQFLSKTKNRKALELLQKGYKGCEIAKIVGMSATTICKVRKLGITNQKNK